MSRKKFILEQGATCKNWNWSWSFVDHDKKRVIFGAWDVESIQERSVILREEWEYLHRDGNARKQPGYSQAIEHLKLVSAGYHLYTFDMEHSEHDVKPDVSIIKGFTPRLDKRYLRKESGVWYAYFDPNPYPDDLDVPDVYIEGAKKELTVNAYERDSRARQICINYHGISCKCCGFNFEETYGDIGKDFIHVHHIKPLHTIGVGYILDPIKDLIPLCPNCHAMIHRGSEVLLPAELIKIIEK